MTGRYFTVVALSSLLLLPPGKSSSAEIQFKTQGYSLQLDVSNQGTFGSVSQVLSFAPWVGGLVDTSLSGSDPAIALVTTGNEGWAGPLFEFAPGADPADTIWEGSILNPIEPTGWSDYWGEAFPFDPTSHQDFYSRYQDDSESITNHIPLALDIVQSSFAWDDPVAEGMIIIEYRITTSSLHAIEQAWFGLYSEASMGPSIAGYSPTEALSYFLPTIPQSPAVGVTMLHSSLILGSLDVSYSWYEGPDSPAQDSLRYSLMSSASIMFEQDPPGFARNLLSFGPFTLGSSGDTLVFAVAILSGDDLTHLQALATAAKDYYLLGGIPAVIYELDPPQPTFSLSQNFPNPFNPTTEIAFQTSDHGPVSLRVYDILGREVATLVNETLFAGDHVVKFSGDNLASGAYYYRLTAGANTTVKRMMLLR